MIDRQHITGVILAGGRGSRMGGIDKGLQPYRGVPMALHALTRLRPQVGSVLINANRHVAEYRAFGVPVWPDTLPDQPGPLAGFLAGLAHCDTTYLSTVPCDSPLFPHDLVQRLAAALDANDADIAMAATQVDGERRSEPVFCLMKTSLRESLARFVASGARKIDAWAAQQRRALVVFDDVQAFANANTLAELQQLQSP
jgi:molybdopterin-guanine dinucleotide biosynthesis protein A